MTHTIPPEPPKTEEIFACPRCGFLVLSAEPAEPQKCVNCGKQIVPVVVVVK